MVVGMWGVKAGRLDERRLDSRAKSRWGCRRINPILMAHGLYSTDSPGEGWVGKKACIKTKR